MIIRDDQFGVFNDTMVRNLEDRMVRHLQEFSPQHSDVIGEPGVRQVVRRGLARADKHRFTYRGPVRLYLELVYMFGSDFDIDPLYPWAGAILTAGDETDQMERAKRLHEKALEYSDTAAGPNFEYSKKAFQRAQSVRYEDLMVPPRDFEAGCSARLRAAHPEKFAYVGEPAIREMIGKATAEAQTYSVTSPQGVFLFVSLMFALGRGFANDPLYPWIAGTLNNDAIGDPNKRAERLYSKTMTYLDHVVAHLA